MFVVFLRFSVNKSRVAEFMDGHNAWIRRGIEDGVFALVGSLQPNAGGAVLAYGLSREAIEARVEEDPFVAENIVTAEILEISPGKTDPRLEFLMDQS